MAKKVKEETLNLDNILFKCGDILSQTKNSGSFFKKRNIMLTLVFLRFISEKYEDSVAKLRQKLIAEGHDSVLVGREAVPSDFLLRLENDTVKFLLLDYNPMQPVDFSNINIPQTQRRGSIRYLPFVTTLENIFE